VTNPIISILHITVFVFHNKFEVYYLMVFGA